MNSSLLKAALPATLALLAMTFGSCSQDELVTQSKEEGKTEVGTQADIQNYLRTLPLAPQMTRANAPVDPEDGSPIPTNEGDSVIEEHGSLDGIPGNWVKTTRRYKMTHSFDENFLFDPTVDIIYPGCVLKGGTIANGTYAMITSHQTGDITFSISLAPANPAEAHATSATIPNIRKSEYQEVWNKWATMDWKESPVTTIESVEKINSQEELVTKLGVAVTTPVGNGSVNLGFNFNKKRNHILARLIQKHFSVSTDAPKKGTIFESIDKDALDGYQPVYISNINYGRVIYLSIDTDESEKNINEAIEFALNQIKGVDVNVSVDQALTYRKMLAKSDVHITVLGGGKTIQQEILKGDIDSFQKFLAADIPMEQMQPISFSLRYAVDNSQARVVTNNEFTVTQRDFVPVFNKVRMQLRFLGFSGKNTGPFPNIDKDARIWGDVGISMNGQETGLVSIPKNNPFYFDYREKDETMHPFDQNNVVNIEFDKTGDESLEDFIDHQKISFYTDLHSARGNYNFGKINYDHTFGTLYSLFKSDNRVIKLDCSRQKVRVSAYVEIMDLKFFNK